MTYHTRLALGGCAIAVAAFCGGVYYSLEQGPLPLWLEGRVRPGPSDARHNSISGTVVSRTDSTLMLSLPDGSTQTVSIGPATRVMINPAPIQRNLEALIPGTSVVVINGAAGTPAPVIQILPRTVPAVR